MSTSSQLTLTAYGSVAWSQSSSLSQLSSTNRERGQPLMLSIHPSDYASVGPKVVCRRKTTCRTRDYLNNMRLNHVKSMEIVFVSPRYRRAVVIHLPAVPTISKVARIKVLGVVKNRKLSVAQHVHQLGIRASFAQSPLYHCTLCDINGCRQMLYIYTVF